MDGGSTILLIVVFFIAIAFGLLQLQSEEELKNQHPVSTSNLSAMAKLGGGSSWTVTIVRRSGYVHDEWQIKGSAASAIQSALLKLHQARIFEVLVRENSPTKIDVVAAYDSSGKRRTGKYVGGFIIQRS